MFMFVIQLKCGMFNTNSFNFNDKILLLKKNRDIIGINNYVSKKVKK